jgi:hypothetical protein
MYIGRYLSRRSTAAALGRQPDPDARIASIVRVGARFSVTIDRNPTVGGATAAIVTMATDWRTTPERYSTRTPSS